MKQTVLHQKHLQVKAKLTEYQDWQTPLQFSDVLDAPNCAEALPEAHWALKPSSSATC